MTSAHYVSEDKSDMRGIKHGWYAMEDDGNLSSGPFSSREECIKKNTPPIKRDKRWRLSCNKVRSENTSSSDIRR
jgi:hypothetical protein